MWCCYNTIGKSLQSIIDPFSNQLSIPALVIDYRSPHIGPIGLEYGNTIHSMKLNFKKTIFGLKCFQSLMEMLT